MQILFVHQNFPGQYRYLSKYFTQHPDWDCYAIGERENVKKQLAYIPRGIKLLGYDEPKKLEGNYPASAREFAGQMQRSLTIAPVLMRQKNNGLDPRIICAHPGWGEGYYLREIFPEAKLLYFFEFFFEPDGPAVGFDPEFPRNFGLETGYRLKNAQNFISLDMADAGVSPTRWQWQTFPEEYRKKIRVIHDGVDTTVVKPDRNAILNFPKSNLPDKCFSAADEIITFSVRNLEPSRGFHRYMRALPRLQKLRPDAFFVIVGGDEKSYVKGHESGKPWREVMLEEVGDQLDMNRLVFVGKLPYQTLLQLFSISSLHIYMTIPFVLSWSMLEVMACETTVLGSATGPVEEFITEGENGFLFDYFSEDAMVEKVGELMKNPQLREEVGRRARQFIVDNYDLETVCLPQHLALIDELISE